MSSFAEEAEDELPGGEKGNFPLFLFSKCPPVFSRAEAESRRTYIHNGAIQNHVISYVFFPIEYCPF